MYTYTGTDTSIGTDTHAQIHKYLHNLCTSIDNSNKYDLTILSYCWSYVRQRQRVKEKEDGI